MIKEFDTTTITKTARIGFLLACTTRVKKIFQGYPNTALLISQLINDGWSWLEKREPGCSSIYWTHNPKLMEQELLFHENPSLLKAFHVILYMHYYTIQKMHIIEYFESGGVEPSVGSDVFDVDEDYFFNCINGCIEVSDDPAVTQKWIEDIIARLQIEMAPTNPDDNGQIISQDYFL